MKEHIYEKIRFIAGAFVAAALLGVSASAEKLPEKYDLREVKNALPEIFAQGNLGSCWSIASNSAFEIALCMNNIKDENGKYYELSMYHKKSSHFEKISYKRIINKNI